MRVFVILAAYLALVLPGKDVTVVQLLSCFFSQMVTDYATVL